MPASIQDYLAIDFGTSNSLVSAVIDGKVMDPLAIDPSSPEPTILKSVLYSPEKSEWSFGHEAIHRYYEEGAQGRIFRSLKKFLPEQGFKGTQVHGAFHSIEDLISRMLRELKQRAEVTLDKDVTKVILGRPALFSIDEASHQLAVDRLITAAKMAGFKEVSFCPEPVAAAYTFIQTLTEPKTVLIADFGAGTTDYSIVRLGKSAFSSADVLAIGGVSVAGDALDSSIMEESVAPLFGSKIEYQETFGTNVLSLPRTLIKRFCSPPDMLLLQRQDFLEFFRSLKRKSSTEGAAEQIERLMVLIEDRQGYALFQEIEKAKILLSKEEMAWVDFAYPTIEIKAPVSYADFSSAAQASVAQMVLALDRTMEQAGLSYNDIELVCCTGGTARARMVQEALEERLGKNKLAQFDNFHSVIKGIALSGLSDSAHSA